MKKFLKAILISVLSLLAAALCCVFCISFIHNRNVVDGVYPLSSAMESAGFKALSKTEFFVTRNGVDITVKFDFEKNICKKNRYVFQMNEKPRNLLGKLYIDESVLNSVLGGDLDYRNGEMVFEEFAHIRHEWTKMRLIAHSGGGVREDGYNSFYTNSLEAIIQNYNLGHRVFEMDFMPTSDGNLAAVHDWDQYGNFDGTAMSAQEWKNTKTNAIPVTDALYTTMLIGDILDEMTVNKDMYLVTDTKYVDQRAVAEFETIYNEAKKRDIKLLDRVIPQIYNEEMYDALKKIYDFPSIIYTTYANGYSSQRIIDFGAKYDDIAVITGNITDARFTNEVIEKIHQNGMQFFTHTIKDEENLKNNMDRNIDGFYTSLVTPDSFAKTIQNYK